MLPTPLSSWPNLLCRQYRIKSPSLRHRPYPYRSLPGSSSSQTRASTSQLRAPLPYDPVLTPSLSIPSASFLPSLVTQYSLTPISPTTFSSVLRSLDTRATVLDDTDDLLFTFPSTTQSFSSYSSISLFCDFMFSSLFVHTLFSIGGVGKYHTFLLPTFLFLCLPGWFCGSGTLPGVALTAD